MRFVKAKVVVEEVEVAEAEVLVVLEVAEAIQKILVQAGRHGLAEKVAPEAKLHHNLVSSRQ